jgi:hypothetical protein
MSLLPVSFYAGQTTSGFQNLAIGTTTPSALGDGWSISYDAAVVEDSATGGASNTSGDAAWVTSDAASGGHRSISWATLNIDGPNNTAFDFETFLTGPSGGRVMEMRINSGDSVVFDLSVNATVTQVFSATTNGSGRATFEYRKHSTSSGHAYMVAARVIPTLSPSVTTTDTLQPGTEFTLTATNYASAPVSPVTLTDSAGNTGTVPVTISGTGPYTAVGTMPTLAEAVTAGTSLLFGDVTIELST